MPPTLSAKLDKPQWKTILTLALAGLNERGRGEANSWLEELTYLETDQLVARLQNEGVDTYREIKDAHSTCTMQRETGDRKWKQRSIDEESLIRLPNMMQKPRSSVAFPPKGEAAQE
jgi:hypothetical protein